MPSDMPLKGCSTMPNGRLTATSLLNVLAFPLAVSLTSTAFAADFTTPQNAIRSLEAAYISKDVEAAVAAKDFNEEARLMLESMDPQFAEDSEMLKKTADVLELSFRKQMKDIGFPDFSSVECSLGEPKTVTSTLVKVPERCVFPDGGVSEEDLHVFNGPTGWRVVVVPE
ncbi:MAG TPA: hypothetical protein VJV39_00130 [Dongiaceae bacterium]|nr:hypothetical protein [Dongiaceae bacterium]